jgi:NitT/TauT family transport system substrate-binding protein
MVSTNPAWTQKVVNALVRAEQYAAANRSEVAKLISRDGEGFLPMPADAVERAMTLYADYAPYLSDGALQHKGWDDQRIGFQPFPYASALRYVVEAMKTTKVAGDAAFLASLDPDFVQRDLVDDRFVRAALAKYVPPGGPPTFERTEQVAI